MVDFGMVLKRVQVLVPSYDFAISAASVHEAAAVALGKLMQSAGALSGIHSFIVVVDSKTYRVSRVIAEAWIQRRQNPRSPKEMMDFKRWQASVHSSSEP